MFPRYLVVLALLPFAQSQAPQEVQVEIPDDLACNKGKHAAAWKSVKDRFRKLIEERNGAFQLLPQQEIRDTVNAAIYDVKEVGGFAKEAGEECGFGRLAIQLLSVAALEDPGQIAQPIQESNSMANPILTLLLDIPWVATALSGWPFFGILAQLSLQKADKLNGIIDLDAVDGVTDETGKEYFKAMKNAANNGDLVGIAQVSYLFLQEGKTGGGVLGPLTALASQAALQPEVQKRMDAVRSLQTALKSALGTAAELEVSLTTRWPLWSLLHLSVDAFAAA
eukprot:TRINITY_DN51296_c0_g1_i1.p1 TRINITY_DN51296_c0_g1~~TRINITY_DN51296_c0_g1_i1.p1  ORF type:complete len:281 (+),score=76.57 TRINITY_DN51296_c0_g1_i1:67-909(+)